MLRSDLDAVLPEERNRHLGHSFRNGLRPIAVHFSLGFRHISVVGGRKSSALRRNYVPDRPFRRCERTRDGAPEIDVMAVTVLLTVDG